jgi:hypothetical protein
MNKPLSCSVATLLVFTFVTMYFGKVSLITNELQLKSLFKKYFNHLIK